MELELAQRLVTACLNLAVALLAGAGAAGIWLRRGASSWAVGLAQRLRKLSLAIVAIAALSHATLLWLEAASMAEVPLAEALPALRSVLSATHYGLAWMIGTAALAVAAAAVVAASAPGLPLAALAVFLYSRSMVSHAGAGGDFTWAIALDWAHLVLVSIWLGEVFIAGLLVLRPGPGGQLQARSDCAAYVQALSRSATIALAGIAATGLASAWRALGGPANAFGNPYAAILLLKIVLVLCAAALGGLNRFLVMPSLLARLRAPGMETAPAQRRFTVILRVEAMFLLAALLAAAFLSATPPPAS